MTLSCRVNQLLKLVDLAANDVQTRLPECLTRYVQIEALRQSARVSQSTGD